MCDVFMEFLKSMTMSKKTIMKRFKIENPQIINQFKNKKNVITVCGHYSNWEWLIFVNYYINFQFFILYSPIMNPYFDNLIHKIREKHGCKLISRYKIFNTISLNQKEKRDAAYGFVSDQRPLLRKNSYWQKFFGVTVPTFTGAQIIAKKYNMPVVFIESKKIKRGYYTAKLSLITSNPRETKENEITTIFTKKLEQQIKNDPTQYLWTHKRFKFTK